MKIPLSIISQMCFLLSLLAAVPAFSATVVVGTCMPNKVSYDSLTEAVQGVPTGSTIQVCPGTYAEQVVIDKSLTLKGITSGNSAYPMIVPPAGGLNANATGLNNSPFFPNSAIAAQIIVLSGVNVTINGVALDATGSLPICNAIVVGVLVQDSSAILTDVAIKNQLQIGPPPCSSAARGAGILAQNDTTVTQTIKVQNSTFVNAGQAIESDGGANNTTISNNSFAGNSASNENAISIVSGNSTIQGNTIADYNYPSAGTDINSARFAIYMQCPAGGTVANNHISSSQAGIYFAPFNCPSAPPSVSGNDISGASLIGIEVSGSGGLFQGNDIRTSLTAIRLSGVAAGNTIQNNTINDACAAFSSNPAAGTNTLLNNKVFNSINQAIVNTTALCP
ncbi:MAG TPA: hypothetical protein VFA90_09370 [Terriglobales bacterium]|nr:hypothetical protein [Terriglobales bacterium]